MGDAGIRLMLTPQTPSASPTRGFPTALQLGLCFAATQGEGVGDGREVQPVLVAVPNRAQSVHTARKPQPPPILI